MENFQVFSFCHFLLSKKYLFGILQAFFCPYILFNVFLCTLPLFVITFLTFTFICIYLFNFYLYLYLPF